MKKRKLFFDFTQIILGIIEWVGIYFLLMLITRGSYLWTFIIMGLLFLVVIVFFSLFFIYRNKREELYIDEDNDDHDENYDYLETQLQNTIDSMGYDYKIKILNFGLNNPAMNTGKAIFISRDYLYLFKDENDSLDYNLLWAIIFHEIGHAESGITSSLVTYLRISSIIQNHLRRLLHKLQLKEKKILYYPTLVFFYLISLINFSFPFLRNDEHYANKFVCNETDFGIHLLKYYSWFLNDKIYASEIFHPSPRKMYNKISKYFENLQSSTIFKKDNELVFEVDKENLDYMETLANNDDANALSTLGHLYYAGLFVEEDRKKGIEYIVKSYHLGNKKSQKFLYYYDKNVIKEEDLIIDLSKEDEILDAYIENLHEKVYDELYENWDLSVEENINLLNDGARSGNKYAAHLYINHLLDTCIYPIKAQEFYGSISKSYDFFDFSKFDWFEAIDFINFVVNIEEGRQPKSEYVKEQLLKDFDLEKQHVWNYVKFVLDHNDKYSDIYITVIDEMLLTDLDIFGKIKNDEIRDFYINFFESRNND